MPKILIEHGWVIPMDGMNTVMEDGVVAIEDNRIVAVGDSEALDKNDFAADKLIDAKGKAVLPGLVNTHTHLVGAFNKGITEDVSAVSGGLFKIAVPLHDHFVKRENVYFPALVHGMEMLMTGTTTINETWWFQTESAKVVRDLGIRAILSEMIREVEFTQMNPENLDRRWSPKIAEKGFEKATQLIEDWHGKENGRITCRVAPLSPDTITEKNMLRSKDIAEKYGLGLHVHMAQVPGEVEYIRKAYGKGAVEFMNDIGMLGPDLIGIHCVFVTDDEVDILAETDTKVSHTAYLVAKRGYFPPMEKIYKSGVDVSFGSDWCSNDLWKTMRTGILQARVQSGNVDTITGYDALKMATIGGARCLGMDDQIGSLEVGKKADIILLDLDTPWCNPIRKENIITNLVYNANGSDVTHVVVDGKVVVEDKVLKSLDQTEILHKAQKTADRVWFNATELFSDS